jgi:hypothetical protein
MLTEEKYSRSKVKSILGSHITVLPASWALSLGPYPLNSSKILSLSILQAAKVTKLLKKNGKM